MAKRLTSQEYPPKTSKRSTALSIAQLVSRKQDIETELTRRKLANYRNDPVGYARDILGISFWDQIGEMLEALLQPPYRVSTDSAHNVGKSHAAAAAINWWFDTRDPGVVITTAPTKEHVVDVLWAEVRLQRANAKVSLPECFIGPAAPQMRTSPDHWAMGITANSAEAFHGKHRANMLFIFDEKEDVDGPFWQLLFQP